MVQCVYCYDVGQQMTDVLIILTKTICMDRDQWVFPLLGDPLSLKSMNYDK